MKHIQVEASRRLYKASLGSVASKELDATFKEITGLVEKWELPFEETPPTFSRQGQYHTTLELKDALGLDEKWDELGDKFDRAGWHRIKKSNHVGAGWECSVWQNHSRFLLVGCHWSLGRLPENWNMLIVNKVTLTPVTDSFVDRQPNVREGEYASKQIRISRDKV